MVYKSLNFKKGNFLYRGTCIVNEKNSINLLALSKAFQVDVFKMFLCNYLIGTINERNVDGLLYRLQMAHVYKMDALKEECIKAVNEYSIKIVNALGWNEFKRDYPSVVAEIFRKNVF